MDIDEAIDRVEGRMRRDGIALPERVIDGEIAQVEAELAPLCLPAEYRQLLRRLGPPTRLVGFPALHSFEFGLDSWRRDREIGFTPRVLFTIGYTSHNWLAVELASEVALGGELYFWGVGEVFVHLDGGLPGYLAALAAAAPEHPRDQYGQLWVDLNIDRLRSGRTVGHHVDSWPEHWQRAEGITPADLEPDGATATIREVLAARERGPVEKRVHVSIVAVTSTYRESFVTVVDQSGSMILRWSSNVGPAKPQTNAKVELEIRTDPSMRRDADNAARQHAQRDVQRHAQRGDLDGARLAAARLMEAIHDQGVDGEVTAARRFRASG